MSTRRAHIVLPDDLVHQIDDLVGTRGRSEFLVDLLRREVHRLRLLQLLDSEQPGWDLAEHPELANGAAQWVESMRQRDQEFDDKSSAR
jgi:hypothetical protein